MIIRSEYPSSVPGGRLSIIANCNIACLFLISVAELIFMFKLIRLHIFPNLFKGLLGL